MIFHQRAKGYLGMDTSLHPLLILRRGLFYLSVILAISCVSQNTGCILTRESTTGGKNSSHDRNNRPDMQFCNECDSHDTKCGKYSLPGETLLNNAAAAFSDGNKLCGWRFLGIQACEIGLLDDVRMAYQHLDEEGRSVVIYACSRCDIEFIGGYFVKHQEPPTKPK